LTHAPDKFRADGTLSLRFLPESLMLDEQVLPQAQKEFTAHVDGRGRPLSMRLLGEQSSLHSRGVATKVTELTQRKRRA
jgi:hypothetical protein